MAARQRGRVSTGAVVTVAAGVALVASSFLPWGRSGQVDRTSFELVQSAERLGVLTGDARTLALAWYFVPAAVAAAWIAAALGRGLAAAALGALSGALALAAVAVVAASPLKVGPGVPIAAVAGTAAIWGAVLAVVERGRRG